MNYFTKNRFKNLVIIFLIITNVTSVFIFMSKKMHFMKHCNPFMRFNPPPPPPNKNFDFIFKELNLNSIQMNTLEKNKNKRRNIMHINFQNLEKLRMQLLLEITSTKIDTAKIKLLKDSLSILQRRMIDDSSNEFLFLYSLCNSEQKEKLSKIHREMLKDFEKGRLME